jgi:hypothetical protein
MTWDRRQATDGYCSARRTDHILTPDEKTANLIMQTLGLSLMASGHLDTPEKMRAWIEGFQ